jgi:hypothetical protein
MLKAVSPWPGQFLRKSEGLGLGFVSRGMPVINLRERIHSALRRRLFGGWDLRPYLEIDHADAVQTSLRVSKEESK